MKAVFSLIIIFVSFFTIFIPVHATQIIASDPNMNNTLAFGDNGIYTATKSERGTCFVVPANIGGWYLKSAVFTLSPSTGTPSSTAQAILFTTTGSSNTCMPANTNNALAISNSLSLAVGKNTFVFSSPNFNLVPGTLYGISIRIISCGTCNGTNFWNLNTDSGTSYPNNRYVWTGASYVATSGDAETFEIDGDPASLCNVGNNGTIIGAGAFLIVMVGFAAKIMNDEVEGNINPREAKTMLTMILAVSLAILLVTIILGVSPAGGPC